MHRRDSSEIQPCKYTVYFKEPTFLHICMECSTDKRRKIAVGTK